MGPGPGYALDKAATRHLLIADDSALPAMETILAALPASAQVHVLAEVISQAEERALHSPAKLSVDWLARGTDHSQAGLPLESALRALAPLAADTRIYIACEAAAMRRLRKLLLEELGMDHSQVVGRGYWKLDTVNHPDHDYGDAS